MERFVEPSTKKFADKVVFVEKDVDHARDLAQRFRIFGTPTFVLLDSKGDEVTRFGFAPTPDRFEAQIAQAIAR